MEDVRDAVRGCGIWMASSDGCPSSASSTIVMWPWVCSGLPARVAMGILDGVVSLRPTLFGTAAKSFFSVREEIKEERRVHEQHR